MQRLALIFSSILISLLIAAPVSAESSAAPVTCADGTTSPHSGKGACSNHGGIKKSDAAAEKPAKESKKQKSNKSKKKAAASESSAPSNAAPTHTESTAAKASAASSKKSSTETDPSGATARCKDGTYSHSKTHQGTCSRHGGVGEWLDGSGK